MGALNKSPAVLHLLRHLPYIRADRTGTAPEIGPLCGLADWDAIARAEDDAADVLTLTEGYEERFGGKVPAHCVGLTTGGRDFQVLFLDTVDGLVRWMEAPEWVGERCVPRSAGEVVEGEDEEQDGSGEEGEEEDDEEEDDDGGEEDEDPDESESEGYDIFCDAPYWKPREFFTMWENLFRNFDLVPRDTMEVIDVAGSRKADAGEMKEVLGSIFRKHGWPDVERYEKGKCLEEVARVLEERNW